MNKCTKDNLLLGHLLEIHLKECPDSKVTERKNTFIEFCNQFSCYEISQVSEESLRKWLNDLKSRRDYTNKTINAVKIMLNHYFKWLVLKKYMSVNPLLNIKIKRSMAPKRTRILLTKTEMKNILEMLAEFSPDILYPFIFTLAHTGARRNEVRTLKWEHIDFETGFIHFKRTKNGEDRTVRMGKLLYHFLKNKNKSHEYVFTNQWDYLLSNSQICDMIIKLQKDYPNQKKWRCHDMRHSFAHNFLRAGGEMYSLKAILGHRSIQMTVDLYGNLKASDVENVSPYD